MDGVARGAKLDLTLLQGHGSRTSVRVGEIVFETRDFGARVVSVLYRLGRCSEVCAERCLEPARFVIVLSKLTNRSSPSCERDMSGEENNT